MEQNGALFSLVKCFFLKLFGCLYNGCGGRTHTLGGNFGYMILRSSSLHNDFLEFLNLCCYYVCLLVIVQLYPIWLCPHKLHKFPYKTMIYPEPGFEQHHRRGDTPYAQMYTDIGLYYTPNPIFRGEEFDGIDACKKIEQWLIENHGFQALYAVTELNERDFWRMFDATLYSQCREKYKAIGTFMGVYYKSKKGRKTEKEVQEEENKLHDKAYTDPEDA